MYVLMKNWRGTVCQEPRTKRTERGLMWKSVRKPEE